MAFAQRRAVLVRGLGHGRGVVIADRRGERCHQHERFAHQAFDAGAVSLDPTTQLSVKANRGVAEELQRLEHVVGDHGLHHVEFEVPWLPQSRWRRRCP